jgi:hypothetical protein
MDQGAVHDALVIVISVVVTLVAAVWIQPRLERWRAQRSERQTAELTKRNQAFANRIEAFATDPQLLQRYLWHTAFDLLWSLGLMVGAITVATLFISLPVVGSLSQFIAVLAAGGVALLGIDLGRQALRCRITLRAVNTALGAKAGRPMEPLQ